MSKTSSLLLLIALTASAPVPTFASSDLEWRADWRPRFQQFVREEGAAYGLSLGSRGEAFLARTDPRTGRSGRDVLTGGPLQRLMDFIGLMPQGQTEAHMARALKTYLQGREVSDKAFEATLFEKLPGGKDRLTLLGRNLLIDLLTAEDGRLFKETRDFKSKLKKTKVTAEETQAGLASQRNFKLPSAPQGLDEQDLNRYYDGSGADGALTAFDWARMSVNPLVVRDPALQNYAIDREKGTVRVMVAAHRSVSQDRFTTPQTAAEGRRALQEAGLDTALFAKHGAKVVRAVDSMVTVEVPLPQAAKLGLALEDQGIWSRPARVFRTSAAAIQAGPGWLAPTTQFLPFPTADIGGITPAATAKIGPMNFDARSLLHLEGLWKNGMTGKGSIVGIIDTGLDKDHPDFKDRVVEYVDLTGDGDDKDFIGHGTHVAGSVGGSGAASKGKYKGVAPDTKYVIFKVFDKDGNTTEDTILAAMKKAASLPLDKRPQVINMSLGGPGDPVTDPMSQMANRLMLKDNIMVVAAAGNAGPSNGTIGSPGNAQYILTVTGINKSGDFPFFSSRGPIQESDGDLYGKPDLSTVAGDVDLSGIKNLESITLLESAPRGGKEDAGKGKCVYMPGGVISAKSSNDPESVCDVPGMPGYRYMSGTSMAAPMAAGAAADVIGYLRQKGIRYSAVEVKALLMETAKNLKKPSEMQGAGLLNGDRLASTVLARVQAGVPVGNIAYMLSVRLTSEQKKALDTQTRFKMTPLGIVDTKTGRMIKTDEELFWLMKEIKKPIAIAYNREIPASTKPRNA